MIRSKHDSLMVRTNRSAEALRFGDRGGRRTTCTSAAASVSRKARVNRGSRSWIKKRFPGQKAIADIGQVAGDLGHPSAVGLRPDPGDVDAARGQVDEEEHGEPRQPATG